MKIIAFFVLFAVAASRNIQFKPELIEQWENFKKSFGKVYNDTEEIRRCSIFAQTVAEITRHNLRYDLGLSSYRMGINEFSDMEHEEFVKKYASSFVTPMNGYRQKRSLETNASPWVPIVNAKIPDHVDWRTEDLVTPVGHQKGCGCCYAFSAIGSLEGQLKKKTGKLVPLSAQNLVDCSEPTGNGCDGSSMDTSYDYIKRNKGIDTEASYPYKANRGDCHFNRSSVGVTLTGYVILPMRDEDALKQAVATIGPISTGIDSRQFKNYKDGIMGNGGYSGQNTGHAVVVVGYGTENGKDYWLVKNSWGTTWGNKGYIKIQRNFYNTRGIANFALYPLV